MVTPRKRNVDPDQLARDLRERLEQARSKITPPLEPAADAKHDDRPEVRTSRGGRTVTIVTRGLNISGPKKPSS